MKTIPVSLIELCINIAEEQRKLELIQRNLDARKEKLADQLDIYLTEKNKTEQRKINDHLVEVHKGHCWNADRSAFLLDVHLKGKRTGFVWIIGSDKTEKSK